MAARLKKSVNHSTVCNEWIKSNDTNYISTSYPETLFLLAINILDSDDDEWLAMVMYGQAIVETLRCRRVMVEMVICY